MRRNFTKTQQHLIGNKMAKKNFSKGIESILGSGQYDDDGENLKSKKNLSDVDFLEKKVTFIMNIDQLEKIKALAYWERNKNKEILKEALNFFFSNNEDRLNEAMSNYKSKDGK